MKITEYIKETQAEMKHVSWPSRKQAVSFALIIIVVSVSTALALAFFDFIFSKLLTLLV
jgi:preprotein translocase SecE subunit